MHSWSYNSAVPVDAIYPEANKTEKFSACPGVAHSFLLCSVHDVLTPLLLMCNCFFPDLYLVCHAGRCHQIVI
jgi:hypothetical protein